MLDPGGAASYRPGSMQEHARLCPRAGHGELRTAGPEHQQSARQGGRALMAPRRVVSRDLEEQGDGVLHCGDERNSLQRSSEEVQQSHDRVVVLGEVGLLVLQDCSELLGTQGLDQARGDHDASPASGQRERQELLSGNQDHVVACDPGAVADGADLVEAQMRVEAARRRARRSIRNELHRDPTARAARRPRRSGPGAPTWWPGRRGSPQREHPSAHSRERVREQRRTACRAGEDQAERDNRQQPHGQRAE